MGIVDETVQDGVGIGGVTDDTVPGGYGELAGNDRRSAAVAVLKDFQKIVTGLFVERLETPVVQNQELFGFYPLDFFSEGSVYFIGIYFCQEFGQREVGYFSAHFTGLMA